MREVDKGGGWKVREIIGPDAMRRHTQYFYKNKRPPRVPLKSPLAKQLAGYSLIEKDLRNVLIWLEEIDRLFPEKERRRKQAISSDRERFNLIKGLFVAALTFYAKGFTKCEGRTIRLNRKTLEEKYRDEHDLIMKMRNNYAAHSGADRFEEVEIALVLYPSKKSDEIPILYKELIQPDMLLSPDEETSGL